MPGDDGDKEGGKEGGQQEGGAKTGGRGKNMTFPEMMCCMWAALGTNERFSAGAPTAQRLSTSNSAYTQRVNLMQEQDKWRDQHNKLVTTVTPEESIQFRVKEISTKTKDTPISYQQERVVKVCRNELAPLLDKIFSDTQNHGPSQDFSIRSGSANPAPAKKPSGNWFVGGSTDLLSFYNTKQQDRHQNKW
jgi:hypothetical protein